MKKILHRAGIGLFLTLTPLLAVAQSDADVELLTGEFEAARPELNAPRPPIAWQPS